ncbi:glycerophosphodiester phosphodiesterase GDPDL7 isoform X2 [Herrania umbratica]|uniref:glycerophosphodiester phosphodiesterase n=1 Tax=Herrania umbratica TaxID=108875 RepID=A0A6J0ZP23_9ROSI|nr:glycerophosphodiester phosphodiesterase GDPDL7 isoform X2 [Herrania umbratica]
MNFGGKMIRCLLFISLLIHASLAKKQAPQAAAAQAPVKKWQTLSGQPPLVIARGGLSGLFPESSSFANDMANQLKSTDVALFCNLQLTKDGIGICLSDIRLDNSTTIGMIFPKDSKTYNINGQQVKGWFAVDYTSDVIFNNVSLVQSVLSRTNAFDGQLPISTLEDVTGVRPSSFWVNVQYDAFYTEHKLSVSGYLEKAMRFMGINFISSPEIGFLKNMNGKVNRARTKLIFQALDPDVVEPTTKQTYGAILKDLAAIKTFASGILVPKGYIWPVNTNKYLGNPTTLVADAHKLGLEVYASGFANDMPASYNYSYDPTTEYLQFIDSPQFSVDGLLTDFSPTASATIACFAANETTKPKKGKALIITHNGASGMYPGCTDLAYEQAVNDGADIIDCSVQMSKDGVAFCLDSADLTGDTTAMPTFMSRSSSIPEVQKEKGIFSFDLTWSEIQTLKPQIVSPFGQNAGYQRNPEAQNKGKFMTLADFLEFAKAKAVSGILINIENAAYLASKKGLDMGDSVTKALGNATFDKQQTQQVLVQSDDTSVLSKFPGVPAYKRLLRIKEEIGDAPKLAVDEIKKYADGVVVGRPSLISTDNGFTQAQTNVLQEMHAGNISVYVFVLRNEFVALPFDFYADPMVELATYVAALEVDGVITDFPGTSSRYMRSPCVDLNGEIAIIPAEPGALLKQVPPMALSPANPPNPPLEVADVVDPPLPPVANVSSSTADSPGAPAPSSSGMAITANFGLGLAAIMALSLLSLGY